MTKSSKTLLVVLMAVLLCASITLVACGNGAISVSFGGDAPLTVEKDGTVTAPDFTATNALQVFLGWSTEEGKTASADVLFAKNAKITYEQLQQLAVEGAVAFYPVISTKKTIDLTWNGTEGHVVEITVVEGEIPTVTAPEVETGAKQDHIGWATTENATESQIDVDAIITYPLLKDLATDGKLTLYPVIKNYDMVLGVINAAFTLKDEEDNVIKDVHDYVAIVAEEFATLYPDVSVLYRVYEGGVEASGAAITADGDVDVVLAGANMESTGKISVICKAKTLEKYGPDGKRYAGLISNTETARNMYGMLLGKENLVAQVTVKANAEDDGITETLYSLLGNSVDVSGITPPASKVIIGFATQADATEPQVVSDSISYELIADLVENGAVTLYPVFGNYDLVVAVWAENSSTVYVTADELSKIEEDFRAYLAEQGITDAIIRFDSVKGKTDEYAATISDDVLVVLSGKNVLTQCEGTVGGYKCVNIETTSVRYFGEYAGRATSAQQAFVDMFKLFVAEDVVEVTLGEQTTSVSLLSGNTVDVSSVVVPEGKELAGFATSEDATEPLIVGTTISYATVKEHATDGAITLYPVFASYDLVIGVWGINGSNTYATDEQVEALKSGFIAFLATKGVTGLNIRVDMVSGSSKSTNSTYYPTQVANDVQIILGGASVETQCGTTGKHTVSAVKFASTRYASVYTERVTAEQQTLVDYFIEFVTSEAQSAE